MAIQRILTSAMPWAGTVIREKTKVPQPVISSIKGWMGGAISKNFWAQRAVTSVGVCATGTTDERERIPGAIYKDDVSLEDKVVTHSTCAEGNLTARNVRFEIGLYIKGDAALDHVEVLDNALIRGYVQAIRSNFHDKVIITSQESDFNNCTINGGITVKQHPTFPVIVDGQSVGIGKSTIFTSSDGTVLINGLSPTDYANQSKEPQIVRLRNTTVDSVTFERSGEVHLYGSSSVGFIHNCVVRRFEE